VLWLAEASDDKAARLACEQTLTRILQLLFKTD
jgi:hypothetical protein